MDKIENLIKTEIGVFDTPKKINQSEKKINQEIIDRILSENVKSEDLATISESFPIFRYKTCITIHGNFSGIPEKMRVGGYQNLIMTGCGTLEILWSAIDTEKIEQIKKITCFYNSDKGTYSKWFFHKDSRTRYFFCKTEITSENKNQVVSEYIALIEKIKGCKFFGDASCYLTYDIFGNRYIYMNINILGILQKDVQGLIDVMLEFYGIDMEQRLSEIEAKETKQRLEQEQRDAKSKSDKEISDAYKLRVKKESEYMFEPLSGYEINKLKPDFYAVQVKNTSCKEQEDAGEFEFIYKWFRLGKKGAFGRFEIEFSTSSEFHTPKVWEKYISKKIYGNSKEQWSMNEMEIKGYLVPIEKTNQQKPKTEGNSDIGLGGVKIIQYSEKSIAVIGNTIKIKEKIKAIGGKWNNNLSCGKGWILPKTKETEIKNLLRTI